MEDRGEHVEQRPHSSMIDVGVIVGQFPVISLHLGLHYLGCP